MRLFFTFLLQRFNCLEKIYVFNQATDLSRSEASEEDKIKAMMTQSTQDYDPSKYYYIHSLFSTTLDYRLIIFFLNFTKIHENSRSRAGRTSSWQLLLL